MKKYMYIIFSLLLSNATFAQDKNNDLALKIRQVIADFEGEIGIYVWHERDGESVNIQAYSLFPTASLVKIPILVGIFDKIKQGEFTLDQKFVYDTNRAYGGSGLMQFYKDSAQTDLSTMIALMLTFSDNVTSIWLQELAGGGARINTLMDELGLINTKVNSRTEGRKEIWEKYGWGHSTPKEMSDLFLAIRQGKVIDKRHSDRMYRYLKNQFYDERSLSQIPAEINTIAKTGSLNKSRSEVVLVNAPSGDYVFTVMTKNNKDESWTHRNSAEELTRKISNIIWNHYEPQYPFTPFERIQ